MSIPQDYVRRWKNRWFVEITKSSPITHWLMGADLLFLLVLQVHMVTVRGHSCKWTQVLAWLGPGHEMASLTYSKVADFIWVAGTARDWLDLSLPTCFPWVYFYGICNAKWSKGKNKEALWTPKFPIVVLAHTFDQSTLQLTSRRNRLIL